MSKMIDLTGRVFRSLTVLRRTPRTGGVFWLCRCACGAQTEVLAGRLTSGNTGSCGCVKRNVLGKSTTKHGQHGKGTYGLWKGMRTRCNNPKSTAFKNYGARGVTVCPEWDDYACFLRDMGPRPTGATLERKDNAEGYSKANCIWAPRSAQSRNTRRNVWLQVGTLRMILKDWAHACGVIVSTINMRLARGWPVEAALTLPSLRGKVLHISED